MNMRKVIREAAEKAGIMGLFTASRQKGITVIGNSDSPSLEAFYLAAERAGWERAIEQAAQEAIARSDKPVHGFNGMYRRELGVQTATAIRAIQYTEPKE